MKYLVFEWKYTGERLGERNWFKVMEGHTFKVCQDWVGRQKSGNYIICSVAKEINK